MKLFKITVLSNDRVIERGVWADEVIFGDTHLKFYKHGRMGNELSEAYPLSTMITSIETKEEVEARKAK